MKIIFQTPRFYLREFTLADTSLVFDLNQNPEVIKYLHEPTLENEEQAKKIINDILLPQYKNNLGRWAVHLKQTDAFIGWCGLKYLPESDEIDLGYRFFQQYWGNGYATEAARYTLDHAFNILHLSTITGRAHIENHASQNVLEKIGMRFIKEEMEGDCPLKIYSISRFPTK